MNRLTTSTDRRRDEGMTLVELTVAMVVAGLVAVMVATTTIQAFRIQRDTTVRETDSTNAVLAMDTLSRDVRQATAPRLADGTTIPAFSTASPTAATFVTWVGTDPVKVTYTLSGGMVTRTVQRPDSTGNGAQSTFTGAGSTTTGVLVRSVTSTSLFSYGLSDGRVAATITSADDLQLVDSVTLTLTVDSDPTTRLPGTTLSNTVACQNL